MSCIDGHATKKTSIVMHHAVSDLMVNWDDARVARWFSDVGRNRGYAGIAHSYHCNPYTGEESFSQAQYCLHPYTLDGNKYGWRLTLLITNPFENACWHASNWPVNQSSIGIETAGNYSAQRIDEKALMLIADTFRWWDAELKGWLYIYPHNQFAATSCPGMIAQQLPDLYDMFNNGAKWEAKLWPVSPPVADDLYRVSKSGTPLGSFSSREEAFDVVYLQSGDSVTFNGKDITSEFTDAMNVLEKQVSELKVMLDSKAADVERLNGVVGNLEASLENLTVENTAYKTQLSEVSQANQKNLKHIEDLKGLFSYTSDIDSFKGYLEAYKAKCEVVPTDDGKSFLTRFFEWLRSVFEKG